MSGIKYSTDIKVIGKFEHPNNISVNVYGHEDIKIFPLLISTITVGRHHATLLYINAGEKSHFVLVKDLSRLVSSQYNNHKHKTYFCQFYLHSCTNEDVLKNHLERCMLHGAQRIKLPETDNMKGHDKNRMSILQKQNNNHVYLLSSTPISKA